MCDKYNGWSNYQTWVFNLWYDDSFSEDAVEFHHQATVDYRVDSDQVANNATYALQGYMKDIADELVPDDASVSSDLFGHAVGMIDFYEIAEHYIDEIVAQEEVTV